MHYIVLYPQNGNHVMTIDSVTSLHPVYTVVIKPMIYKLYTKHCTSKKSTMLLCILPLTDLFLTFYLSQTLM